MMFEWARQGRRIAALERDVHELKQALEEARKQFSATDLAVRRLGHRVDLDAEQAAKAAAAILALVRADGSPSVCTSSLYSARNGAGSA